MQAVERTKLFDITADPRENEYVAQRKALTFVDKWGDWSQDWRSFDADLSLSGKTKRVKWIFCLSFVFLGGTGGCRRPLTRFQGQMLTIHGKVDGDSKARDWRIRGWLWRLWTNCRQDSRRRILTHRQSVRLCPSALCLCACCTTCAMIAIIFHKHIFVRPCLRMDWAEKHCMYSRLRSLPKKYCNSGPRQLSYGVGEICLRWKHSVLCVYLIAVCTMFT